MSNMAAVNEQITIRLTSDEALVLFAWLHRCEDEDEWVQSEHRGEQVALWNLSALLERALVQPFARDYLGLVRAARSRLRDEESEL